MSHHKCGFRNFCSANTSHGHTRINHGTHKKGHLLITKSNVNESCHILDVASAMSVPQIHVLDTHMDESYHARAMRIPNVCSTKTSHGTQMNESWHTHE